jgi:hypothetical protein
MVCSCRRCVQQKHVLANWGQSLHLQCSIAMPGNGALQTYKWLHIPSSDQINEEESSVTIKYG